MTSGLDEDSPITNVDGGPSFDDKDDKHLWIYMDNWALSEQIRSLKWRCCRSGTLKTSTQIYAVSMLHLLTMLTA